MCAEDNKNEKVRIALIHLGCAFESFILTAPILYLINCGWSPSERIILPSYASQFGGEEKTSSDAFGNAQIIGKFISPSGFLILLCSVFFRAFFCVISLIVHLF